MEISLLILTYHASSIIINLLHLLLYTTCKRNSRSTPHFISYKRQHWLQLMLSHFFSFSRNSLEEFRHIYCEYTCNPDLCSSKSKFPLLHLLKYELKGILPINHYSIFLMMSNIRCYYRIMEWKYHNYSQICISMHSCTVYSGYTEIMSLSLKYSPILHTFLFKK